MPVIRVTDELYRRLEAKAQGFDTPSSVIERLLDAAEGYTTSKPSTTLSEASRPSLEFYPDETTFKAHLASQKPGKVVLHYANGREEERTWHAQRFTENSNLRGNIWSGYLRGWREEGIVKAEFIVQDSALQMR